jgi:ribose transport system permease protein
VKYRLIGVVLLALALGLSSDAFATPSNLLNVLRQASLVFLSASGLTLVIVGAGLDLSVGANRQRSRPRAPCSPGLPRVLRAALLSG